MTKPAIGEHSRPLRYLIVTFMVAVYWTLGFLLHLNLAEYQLLGIPLLLIFQLGIHRKPPRTLWVRSGPPLRLDARFFILWIMFSLIPAFEALSAAKHMDLANAALYSAGIAGAFGLTYALRAMRVTNVWQLGLCLLTAGGIGLLPQLLSLLLPHLLHLHIGAGQANVTKYPAFLPSLQAGAGTFFWGLPAGFFIEEVFFRGALDTYLHHGEKGTGWLSAIFVSALWGLWHLSGGAIQAGHLISTVVGLLVAQIAVGVPLSLWWRKSGNLIVNNTTHAHGTDYFSVAVEPGGMITFENSVENIENIDASRLFERFYTADISRNTKSTGLGLAICKELVEKQNGKIKAQIKENNLKITIEIREILR